MVQDIDGSVWIKTIEWGKELQHLTFKQDQGWKPPQRPLFIWEMQIETLCIWKAHLRKATLTPAGTSFISLAYFCLQYYII